MRCSEEGDRRSARGRRIIDQRVTREVWRPRVNQLREINLSFIFRDGCFRKLKMVET